MAKKGKNWREQMAATLGFDEDATIEKSADDDADLEKARKMVPPAGDDGEDDEDLNARSQEDMEKDAAPEASKPPTGDDGEDDGEDEPEPDEDDEEGTGEDDGDEDDDDLKGKVIRRSQANPDLLKSMFMEAPDLLKSLFEGEGGQKVAELIDASDTVGFIVDTFDRLLSQQQKDHNLVVKSLEIRMSEMGETMELLGQGLTEAVGLIKSLAAPDLVKSRNERAPAQRIGSGLGGLMPPRRVDPVVEEQDPPARRTGGKPKRAALTEEAANTLLKSRLPVRQALMSGVDAGLIHNDKAAEFIGKLGSPEGIRDTLAFMAALDAKPENDGFFKSQPGVDVLLGRSDILIKAS